MRYLYIAGKWALAIAFMLLIGAWVSMFMSMIIFSVKLSGIAGV